MLTWIRLARRSPAFQVFLQSIALWVVACCSFPGAIPRLVLGQDASTIPAREGLPVVSWEEARQVVGKSAVIYGRVVSVGGTPTIQFLNFSKSDRTAFSIVVFSRSWPKFKAPLKRLYEGQLVEIRGVVTLFGDRPQIVAEHPGQIRVVDRLPRSYFPARRQRAADDELKLASLNVRNLFDGFDDPYTRDESTPEKPRAELERLAETIRDVNADVLALQEVESRGCLQRFLDKFLDDMGYRHVVLVEGNDPRGIDVGLVSRVPVGRVVSHAQLRFDPEVQQAGTNRFQRDLLCVEIRPPGKENFHVWVVHLKSQSGPEDAEPIRLSEARQIRLLVERRCAEDAQARFVICGDFNDDFASPAVQTIVGAKAPHLAAPFDTIPRAERITYSQDPHRSMIDFLFFSPALAEQYVAGSMQIRPGTLATSGSDHNPVSCRIRVRPSDPSGPSEKLLTPAISEPQSRSRK